jgi:transcriptional regulator with XRE-family HTH domain
MSDRSDEETRGLAALGAAIRTLRTEADLSEGELSEQAQVEPALLAAVEAGRREPTWGDLRRIARGLETPLEQVLELAERLERAGPGPSA